MDETSQPIDVLVSVTRDGPGTLGTQIEDQLRRAIREGALKDLADCGTARIEQRAFADFLARGEFDRHLRRMRARYRRRRDRLIDALGEALPEATIRGIAAGLHATVELPGDCDERAILAEAHSRSIDLTTVGEYWIEPGSGPPTLLIGYGQLPARPPSQRWLRPCAADG